MDSGTTKSITVTLQSSDGELFKVPEAVAKQSRMLCFMMEPDKYMNHQDDVFFPIPNVSARILAKVIKYCRYKVDTPADTCEEEKRKWEKQYVDVDQKTVFDLIHAANYMDIEDLLDLMCNTVADMMRGKSPEEIRRVFNIKNDLTPEENNEIYRENEWAMD